MSNNNEDTEVELEFRFESEFNYKIETADRQEIWLSKQYTTMSGDPTQGELTTFTMPQWYAENKGLV